MKKITSICPSSYNKNSFWTCSEDSYVKKLEFSFPNPTIDWRNPKGHANYKMILDRNDEMIFILDSAYTIYNLRIKTKYLEPFMKYELPGANNLAVTFECTKIYVANINPGQLWEIDVNKKQSNELSSKFSFMKNCRSLAITQDDRWLFCGDNMGNLVIFDLQKHRMHEVWERYLKSSIDNIYIMKGGKYYWIIASSFDQRNSRDST